MLNEKPLAKNLEFFNSLYKPRSKLNEQESLYALATLIERYGAFCYFCKKPAWKLMIEDNALREIKGLPKRQRRILVVHERIRGIFDTIVLQNEEPILVKWGGCVPACYSCNQRLGSVEPREIDKKSMTWQAKKFEVRDKFKKQTDIAIAKETHVCKKMVINIASSAEHLHCSQEVLEEAVKQNVGVTWDIINIELFNIPCEYCQKYYGDNIHIISKDRPPTRIATDMEVAQAEKEGEENSS